MEFEKMKEFLNKLQKIVMDLDEQFREIAFKSILEHFLKNELFENKKEVPFEPPQEKQKVESQQIGNQLEGLLSKLSLPEIFKKANCSSNTDRALIIAFDFSIRNKMSPFNVDIIRKAFSDSLIPKPINISDVLNGLIKRGHLRKSSIEVDKKKGFEITQSGLDYIKEIINQ